MICIWENIYTDETEAILNSALRYNTNSDKMHINFQITTKAKVMKTLPINYIGIQ